MPCDVVKTTYLEQTDSDVEDVLLSTVNQQDRLTDAFEELVNVFQEEVISSHRVNVSG